MPNLRPLGCFLLVYFGVVLLVVVLVLVVLLVTGENKVKALDKPTYQILASFKKFV